MAHIEYQVKVVNGHLVFSPPKRGKERDVPLPDRVAHALRLHSEKFAPVDISLPWLRPDGPTVTGCCSRSSAAGRSDGPWKPVLVEAGVIRAAEARGAA